MTGHDIRLPLDASTESIVDHVVGCEPCEESLVLARNEPELLSYLRAVGQRPHADGIDRLFAETLRGGVAHLSNRVYELSKVAAQRSEQYTERVTTPVPARDEGDVLREARVSATRLAGMPGSPDVVVATGRDLRAASLRTAHHGLGLLERLEGETPRQQLLLGHVWLTERDYPAAERIIRALGERKLPDDLAAMTGAALGRCLIRQSRFQEALDASTDQLESHPRYPGTLLNAAIAAAHAGNQGVFQRVSAVLRALDAREYAERWQAVGRHVAPGIAKLLCVPAPEALLALGLTTSGAGGRGDV